MEHRHYVIFALVAAYFAHVQRCLGDIQLRVALFERRVAVHDAMRRLVSDVLTTGKAPLEVLFTMLRETRDAKFLFKPDDRLAEFIHEFYKHGVHLQTTQSLMEKHAREEPERLSLIESQARSLEWFSDQDFRIEEKFRPYLQLW